MKFGAAFLLALSMMILGSPQMAISAPRPAIAGVWKSDCLPIGKNGRHGFITRLEIKGRKAIASSQVYAHNTCDIPTVRTDYRGSIASTHTNDDGAVDFDHVVGTITTTPNHAEVVTIYNSNTSSGCEFSGGWQLGVPRAVDGRTCASWTFPKAGTRLYERAWVVGDELRIGSFPTVWDNTTAEKRPSAPGSMVFHRLS